MNCRERVLASIKNQYPDKIPLTYSIFPEKLFRDGQKFIDLCKKYPNDFYDIEQCVKIPKPDTEHYLPDGSYYKEETDEWGSVRVFLKEGIAGEVKKPVLSDWSKMKTLKMPPVPNPTPAELNRLKEAVKKQKEKYVGWGSWGSLFEQMQWIRGTENLFLDIAYDVEEIYKLADILMEKYLIPRAEIAVESGVDIVSCGDDWGTQTQLLINPSVWRKIFKPQYKKIFDLVHQGGALNWMHSDGMIMEIIPDLIEIGVDVLNPQLSCMKMEQIQQICNGRICISGDIDRQWTLVSGTPEQVRKYIRKATDIFGLPSGGFIYSMELREISFENAEAVLEAIYEFRNLSQKQ
jgi:uroporphyrinogen decarboxylase